MRSSFLLFLLFSLSAFADQLTVTVTAPDGQPVANARVILYRPDNKIAANSNTAGNGTVHFDLPSGAYTAEVLAPSFAKAAETITITGETNKSVRLHIAAPEQTIQVTAAGTP
ncbi:MAG TPA: carboxypeptidase-like regulatory domain-containing protein, partial [Terriglobales bacterium]|nr:carboxypeptidase-like regulatory domain-containing protein [Terriglobales bacterium]